jgi:hypothetical protein
MASHGERKDIDGERDPFKLLLKETLMRKRNGMMDNFALILRRQPTSDTYSSSRHLGGVTTFKVQLIFDIPLFEG